MAVYLHIDNRLIQGLVCNTYKVLQNRTRL